MDTFDPEASIMIRPSYLFYFPAVFFLFMSTQTVSAQKNIVVESWEYRTNAVQPPEKIMDVIGLKAGMVIGDIGAGTGRMIVWFSDRVGEEGRVLANDIDQSALEHLRDRCEEAGMQNVFIIHGRVEDVCMPEDTLDIAFMINVYHHLKKPVELVKTIIPALKPGGILAIVEHDPVKSGYPGNESTPRDRMIRELGQAGFTVIRTEDFLKNDYIYLCKPKENGS